MTPDEAAAKALREAADEIDGLAVKGTYRPVSDWLRTRARLFDCGVLRYEPKLRWPDDYNLPG